MPWTASSVMEERLRFVARLLDGETTKVSKSLDTWNEEIRSTLESRE
jgi:hypothetical protein